MNYQLIYDKLITRAYNRQLGGYKERHHIVPKCLGGSDDKTNLVDLTPEEHYVAHQLLVKIHPNHLGLLTAIVKMSGYGNGSRKSTNKLFGWIKRRIYSMRVGVPRSEETKKKISESRKNQPPSHIVPHNEITKQKISLSRQGKGTAPKSAETKKRMSDAAKGRKMSEEQKIKISLSKKGKPWSQARIDSQYKDI
jgi:hypothetical protein